MSDDLVERARHNANADMPHYASVSLIEEMADRIEKLEATNARLETEAKIQAEEIDKTRRRADKWQSMVLDCEEYLKFGETPAERIEREINDCLALMKLLETKQVRIEELEAELSKAVGALGDIYDGEPEWPSDPQKELDWCRNRAKRAIAELKGQDDE